MQALVKLSHFALAIRLVFSWKKLTVLSSIARRVGRGGGGGGGKRQSRHESRSIE